MLITLLTGACLIDTRGRFQTEAEADIMADEMKDYLNNLNIKYKELDGVKESYDLIVNEILEKTKRKSKWKS